MSKSVIPGALKPFLFSLLVISSWSVKGLHLVNHLQSIGPLDYIILLPLLLLQDLFLLTVGRTLLARSSRRWKILDPGVLGLILTATTAVSSAVEIAFYWETSAEIKWAQAAMFIGDQESMKLLVSGANKVFVVFLLLIVLAKISAYRLYEKTGIMLRCAAAHSKQHFHNFIRSPQSLPYYDQQKTPKEFPIDTSSEEIIVKNYGVRNLYQNLLPCLYLAALTWYTWTTLTPYKHLMGSLPFSLLGDFENIDNEFCAADNYLGRRPFPRFEGFQGDFQEEWAPRKLMSEEDSRQVDWLPDGPVEEFQRWYKAQSNNYDPRHDPLRISNSKSSVLGPLQDAFLQNNVAIKNVLMITMESTRKDVFPIRENNPLAKIVLSSHEDSSNVELLQLLGNISRTAETLTGESTSAESAVAIESWRSWRNLSRDLGGVNVQGAISSSTYTLKNLLVSHCGVSALPVDFAMEAFYDIYQPCLPHILGLFDSHKQSVNTQKDNDFLTQEWDTTYLQAATDQFDHQSIIMKKIGFPNIVSREQLHDPKSRFYPPTEPESNYLGYSDAQLKPYIQGIIETARDNNRRFFTSVLTSTTHYPWVLPAAFGEKRNYMGKKGWVNHEMLNSYLNTIKYADAWLADIMDMLQDTGVANETLVVLAGDHGFAFVEDDLSYSVYDGAHIANFKIPLLFYHPNLPRIQLSINASTMSILPTILDLLVSSNSLDSVDGNVTSQLLNKYQGQSLIREFKTEDHGQHSWHFSLLNPGGSFLAISSAAVPWRLVMPLCQTAVFRFTDLSSSEMEEEKLADWTIEGLRVAVAAKYDEDAARWVVDAKAAGTWWFWETRRLWKFGGTSRQESPRLPEFLAQRVNETGKN